MKEEEALNVKGGEAVTLAGVLAVLAVSIIVVVCYRFFVSPKGKVTLPGGYEFQWGDVSSSKKSSK